MSTNENCTFAHVYNVGVQKIKANQSVEFSNNGKLKGVTHQIKGTQIKVCDAGSYFVSYELYFSKNVTDKLLSFGITVNGELQQQSQVFIQTAPINLKLNSFCTHSFIVDLPSNSVITLFNTSGVDTLLASTGYQSPYSNASLTLYKIC
ncbi:hypothetical protein U0X36_05025 [Bacillus thuringiensis]|uniref:BclA C-terminal domain-containing protein n=1 Tax=Bacillus thuringiensis TaxID=1428 RepID=UPI000E487E3B|nr:hypothetical protein [Bacillus thuringiensis]MDZ3952312.1 hypothetical protein [Bacillus thuringiensis]RGP42307.1 hypothetical protein BTW32_31450 [Bacillus thuringiensis]